MIGKELAKKTVLMHIQEIKESSIKIYTVIKSWFKKDNSEDLQNQENKNKSKDNFIQLVKSVLNILFHGSFLFYWVCLFVVVVLLAIFGFGS